MGFSGLDILGTIAQVAVEAWDSSNRKEIERWSDSGWYCGYSFCS